MPACCRIWALVRLAVSAAKSASKIRERDALTFSEVVWALEMAVLKRFCTAPRPARRSATNAKAPSTTASASLAPVWVPTDRLATEDSELATVPAFSTVLVPSSLVRV